MTATLPEAQVKLIVKEAVIETFLNLGLNVSGPDDIISLQQDMHYLRAIRLRRAAIETKTVLQVVGMVISAIGAAFVLTLYRP